MALQLVEWDLGVAWEEGAGLETNDRSRDVMNYLERLILARGRH